MVRREDDDGSQDLKKSRCASPAGAYGFRPGRSATQALEAIRVSGSGRKGDFVFDADIRDFFGSPDREILMSWVKERVSLIWKWLEAGVMEDGRETKLLSGTPQGGVIAKDARCFSRARNSPTARNGPLSRSCTNVAL